MAIISISDSQVNGADQILVADGSSKIPAKDGSQITILNATNVASGTIASARLDTGTTANKLVLLDGSGNLPAVDASLFTGIVAATISASDPTISTNPSGGVGTEWNNSTSGAMFICTDATAGENVWKNVGAGSGNVQPFNFQGSPAGFVVGGYNWPSAARLASIDEVSFSSDGNATDAGDLAGGNPGRSATTNTCSATHLFNSGGYGPGNYTPNTADVIESFSFATKGTMVDVGNLVHHIRGQGATGNIDYGFVHGGYRAVSDPSGPAQAYNVIWRYAHVSSGNATDVGDLLNNADNPGANSDPNNSYGYSAGGCCPTNTIQRYAMVSSGNAVDVGDLTVSYHGPASSSSVTHGYRSGNSHGTPHTKTIDKFAFAASANATDVGDLLNPYSAATGVTSTTNGYSAGGNWSGGPYGQAGSINIDKYNFSSDGNSTNVGNLTTNRVTMGSVGGQH